MTTLFWILAAVSCVMYCEGALVALVIALASKKPKWAVPLVLLFWPIALPVIGIITYKKYQPMIQQLRSNPMLASMMGLPIPPTATSTQPTNPVAAILNSQPTPVMGQKIPEKQEDNEKEN